MRRKNAITLPYLQWLLKTAAFIDRFYVQERERQRETDRQRKLEDEKYYIEILASKFE
jgi:hypothetical protein